MDPGGLRDLHPWRQEAFSASVDELLHCFNAEPRGMFSFYAIADITSYPQSGAADIKTSNNLITLVPEGPRYSSV